jgi:hypothetical protein
MYTVRKKTINTESMIFAKNLYSVINIHRNGKLIGNKNIKRKIWKKREAKSLRIERKMLFVAVFLRLTYHFLCIALFLIASIMQINAKWSMPNRDEYRQTAQNITASKRNSILKITRGSSCQKVTSFFATERKLALSRLLCERKMENTASKAKKRNAKRKISGVITVK